MSRPVDRVAPAADARAAARRFWVSLSGITAVALAWRIFYVIHERGRIVLNGDAAYYHWEANLVAKGFGFIDPTRYELFGLKTPSAGHPPAYMLYLAGVSKFIGTSELTHRLASTLLGAGAVFMIGVLARRIFGNDWAGLTAAALAAVYAHLWINDEMLMSESMYVLTTALAVLAAYRFWDSPRARTAVWMGLGIALAALSRAEAVSLFPFLAIPFAFLVTRRDGNGFQWKRGAKYALTTCVAGGLLMLPWVAYNVTRFDHPVYVSNGVGSVLMTANCDSTVPAGEPEAGTYRGTFHGQYVGYWSIYCTAGLDAKFDKFYPPKRAAYLQEQLGNIPGTNINFFGDESTHELAWRSVGTAEIKDHLSQMPWMFVLRVARMWDLFRVSQNITLNGLLEGRGVWQSRLATYQYFPLLALSVVGLVLLRRRRVPILPFLAIAATITITAATSFGVTRYRAPVDGMLPVLAAGALVWLVEQVMARRRSAPAPVEATPETEPAPAPVELVTP
jgi:4-amino-4-deoxy-L-arabinose transferase-like glycosyltransferase